MRALYSLVCRLRTLSALAQGTVTLVLDGRAALSPAQLLLLGCGLGIALRVLIPSPRSAGRRGLASLDPLLSVIAAGSVAALTAVGVVDAGLLLGRLLLRMPG